ncbi:MAG: DUF4432 family protein [Spirochaetia bacterium]|jgi:hypothetical protein
MTKQETVVSVRRGFFSDVERTFVTEGELAAALFRFDSGVEAVRISNSRGAIIVLPFQGQQIWDARFDDRVLTMRSLFTEPVCTRQFTATYGAFLLHCGVTAMGNPGKEDTHPLHGELPNAPYKEASLRLGKDEKGQFISIEGTYRHTIAFECDYSARPRVTLRPGETILSVSMEISNLRKVPMELMYLAHINFRPVNDGRLVYSAPCTPDSVRVRTMVPPGIHPPAGYLDSLKRIAADPSLHNVLRPGFAFDPEVVLSLSYRTDETGWAHTLMVHPDGYASYVGHKPAQLPHGVRWISRIPDQDAIGIVLPATAEPDGYIAEKAKGNVKTLPAGESVRYEVEAGLLTPPQAREKEARIQRILQAL